MIEKFDYYLKKEIVRKQAPNVEMALALIKESEMRKTDLEEEIKIRGINKIFSNSLVEKCYDILMGLIRAKLFLEGYNVGRSHEVEISYLRIIGFSEEEINLLDRLRYYRNKIKYYGKIIDLDFAKENLKLLENLYPQIKKVLNEKK